MSRKKDKLSPEIVRKTLAERLQMARADRSQADVAQEANVTEKTIQRYEAGDGQNIPDIIVRLVDLATTFGVSLDWLVGLADTKKPAPDDPERADILDGRSDLVDPRHVEPSESSKMFTGYFDFGDRIVKVNLLMESFGPPTRFGGYRPDEPGGDEDS